MTHRSGMFWAHQSARPILCLLFSA